MAKVGEDGFENNPYLDQIEELAANEKATVVPICAAIEMELAALDKADQAIFLESIGQTEPGLNRVIQAGYDLLGLIPFFPVGPKEARAWTCPKGSTAPQAAGVIHSDFEKGFIRAEVISYDDYVNFGGESGAKEAGKWRLEGKDYIVQDGDVMLFRFQV